MMTVASPPVRPLVLAQVFCVIDGVHDDRSIADHAVDGRYTHAGVTLDLGHEFEWTTCGLDDDEEWRIEFVKLYEGLALAEAFAETGDPAYLHTWVRLVSSYVRTVPVGHESSDVAGRRIQNWIYAAGRFTRAALFSGFPAGFLDEFVARIRLDIDHLRRNLTKERNHRTLEIYALLIADLALGDLAAAAADLDLLAENAATDIWADGVQRECSSDYHLIVLRSLIGALHNARLTGLASPPALVAAADRAATFALWLHRPDGTTPALSDGDQGDFRALMLLAGDVLDRPDLVWVGSNGDAGSPPAARSATFADGGYLFWRTDWTSEAQWGVFDCGPIGDGGHGHYDQLSVELADGHRPLVVDPGRYTYADDGADGWRHWFKGTAAHNTVTVDGLDQITYRRGRPKGPLPHAELVNRASGDGLDVATGRASSPNYDAVHTRSVALVDGQYWVVHDQLRAPTPHRYQARWHLDSGQASLAVVEHADAEQVGYVSVTGNGLRLLFWGDGIEVATEEGWVSPVYGVKHRAPIVTVTVDARDADFFAVIAGTDGPTSVRSSDSTEGAVRLRFGFSEYDETVGWNDPLTVLDHHRTVARDTGDGRIGDWCIGERA